MFPRSSAIGRAIKTASRSAARHAPGGAPRLPESRKDDVRIVGIEGDVDAAGVFVLVKNLLPGLASVGGAENAALGIRAVGMSQRSDKHDIGIRGVDDHLADGAR